MLFCNRLKEFGSKCKDAKYVPMTDELKQVFIDETNKYRNQHALGKTGGVFKDQAADMGAVVTKFLASYF